MGGFSAYAHKNGLTTLDDEIPDSIVDMTYSSKNYASSNPLGKLPKVNSTFPKNNRGPLGKSIASFSHSQYSPSGMKKRNSLNLQNVSSEKTEGWKIYKSYEKKQYNRSGIVKFSYTSSKLYKTPKNYVSKNGKRFTVGDKSANSKFLEKTGSSEEISNLLRHNNAGKIGYISREEAAREPVPEYAEEKKEKPIYFYDSFGHENKMTNEQAVSKLGDNSTYNFILSPEDKNIDLNELTKTFMQYLLPNFKKKVGSNYESAVPDFWVASNHYNTDNPHVHIIISRAEKNGNAELFLSKHLKSSVLSQKLGAIMTSMIGMRTWQEETEIRKMKTERLELSYSDKLIAQKCINDNDKGYILTSENLSKYRKTEKDYVRRRLRFLSSLNLAENCIDFWKVDRNFQNELKKTEYMRLFGLDYENKELREKYISHYDGKDKESYEGKIIAYKKPDELLNRVVLIVEDKDKKLHFFEDEIDMSSYKVSDEKFVAFDRTDRGMKIREKEGHYER